jgi:ketosteroid isomerase-like protein
VTESQHERVMRHLDAALGRQDWDRLADAFHDDAILEYPQSRERFRGLANIRAQFENYPDLEPGSSRLEEVIGDTTYALTPSYTVIRVEGAGSRGSALIRARYPDGSWWWVINIHELRDGRISAMRTYFAPDFEPPDWRAPYREAL